MDFDWTQEQAELHTAARALAGGAPDRTKSAFVDEDWRAIAEFGLTRLCLLEEDGGLGLDLLTSAHAIEGFGEGSRGIGLAFSTCAHLFACAAPIATHGSPVLKEQLLPALVAGDSIGANAITEPEAGSDVFALRTSAERRGNEYRLSGYKAYVTNGPVADVVVVYASTDPGAGPLSLSAFVVESDSEGIAIDPPLKTTGLHGVPIGSVHFDECAVPAANRLGEEGQGALIFDASMQLERTGLFAAYLGSMQRQLDEVVEFASSRKQFGRPIGKNQAISHRIVNMKLRLEQARHLVYRACWLLDRGDDAAVAVSLAKLAVSEAAVQSGLDAIQIHGGAGVIAETGVDTGLLDALPATIFSGTSEMQREIVARRLGL